MRILINGLPYFAKKIADDLNEFDPDNKYVFYNTYYSKWAQLKFLFALPFAGAVISSNGVSDKSKSLDLVLKFNKKLIMQWHGSDVELAIERFNSGSINWSYIKHAKHLASAPWFLEELSGIIDNISYVPFGYVKSTGKTTQYKDVSILTYLGKNNEEYYGWRQIELLAKALPNTRITIIGSDGTGLQKTSNMDFKGWVDEDAINDLMRTNAIFLRMTKHDGKALTVSQALAAGCEVVWTQHMEHCHHVEFGSATIVEKVTELMQTIKDRDLMPNEENANFAKTTMNKQSILDNFVKEIKVLLNE